MAAPSLISMFSLIALYHIIYSTYHPMCCSICDSDDPRFVMSGDSKRDMSGNHLVNILEHSQFYVH